MKKNYKILCKPTGKFFKLLAIDKDEQARIIKKLYKYLESDKAKDVNSYKYYLVHIL